MKRKPRISPAAHATLTRPLIFEDGRFDRGAITRKARSEFRAGRARTWSAAMFSAWDLAHRQIDAARDYDAARRAYVSAPNAPWTYAGARRAERSFPQHA